MSIGKYKNEQNNIIKYMKFVLNLKFYGAYTRISVLYSNYKKNIKDMNTREKQGSHGKCHMAYASYINKRRLI